MTALPKQNLTISLGVDIIRKAKILAAQRSTSISGLLAEQVEALVHADDAYNRAAVSAIARMNRGLRLGGGTMTSREKLHER